LWSWSGRVGDGVGSALGVVEKRRGRQEGVRRVVRILLP